MMTCTSEMSGRASRGIRCMDQMPASVRTETPAKTTKRLCSHHSIIREIMLHPSFGIESEMPGADHAPVLLRSERYLPGAAGTKLARAFIHAAALVGEIDAGLHRRHAHRRHGRHEQGYVNLHSGYRRSGRIGELYAQDVVALARRVRLRGQFQLRLRGSALVHGGSCARARRRRHKSPGCSLQLAFGIDEETGGDHDPLSGFESLNNDRLVAGLA